MGIFTNTSHSSINGKSYDNIPVLEGYTGADGCAIAMLESEENDINLFNAILTEDFHEITSLNEADEEDNKDGGKSKDKDTSTGRKILNKIKEMIQKIMAKIKSIFAGFIVKIGGIFKSGKERFDKYKDKIEKADFSKFKLSSYRDLKVSSESLFDDFFKLMQYDEKSLKNTYALTQNSHNFKKNSAVFTGSSDITFANLSASTPDDDIKKGLVNTRLQSDFKDSEYKDIYEVIMKKFYAEKEEEKSNFTSADFTSGYIRTCMIAGQKDIADKIKELSISLNKMMEDMKKIINDAEAYKENKFDGSMIAGYNKVFTAEFELINTFTAACHKFVIFTVTQANKAFNAAAAYAVATVKKDKSEKTKSTEESYMADPMIYNAIGESVAYDITSDMGIIS